MGELLIAEAVDDQDEVVARVGDQLGQLGAQTSGWGPAGEADLQFRCEISRGWCRHRKVSGYPSSTWLVWSDFSMSCNTL